MASSAGNAQRRSSLDLGAVGGLLLAVAGILGGYLMEHGKVLDIAGESAALIVLGGSLGATLVANPLPLVKRALSRAKSILREPPDERPALVESLVAFATRARKNGLVSLEQEALTISDPFLRKSLMLAVDGVDLQEMRAVMDLEMEMEERRVDEEAKVLESTGGFAPTIGIIGAVLGLIIVMNRLDDMKLVGKGIAAAFVATIYGVGSANLLFLPLAHRMKARGQAERQRCELILEGICGIVEGMNPKMIRNKLDAYLQDSHRDMSGGRSKRQAA